MKNIANSKSAVCLKPVKDVKRPFHVQTKPKENVASSTVNLRRNSSQSKKMINLNEMETTGMMKTTKLTKIASKNNSKPYFPPITANKSNLKLS